MRIGLLKGAPDSFATVMECIQPTQEPIRFALDRERFDARGLSQADLEQAFEFLWAVTRRKSTREAVARFMERALGGDWRTRFRLEDVEGAGFNPLIRLAMAFMVLTGRKLGHMGVAPE